MAVVLFAGIIGGLGPGLLATFLCLVFHLYTTGEYVNLTNVDGPFFRAEWTRAVTFALLGFGIAWTGERLRRVRAMADDSTRAALAREAKDNLACWGDWCGEKLLARGRSLTAVLRSPRSRLQKFLQSIVAC